MIAEPDGTLLVVENERRRVVRINPRTRRTSVYARVPAGPFGLARLPSGDLLVSSGNALWRVDSATRAASRYAVVTAAGEECGPVVVDAQGAAYVATSAHELVRVALNRSVSVLAHEFVGPHGLAVHGGSVLVSDTGHNRVVAVDLFTAGVTPVASSEAPSGVMVAPDGTIYVAEFGTDVVGRVENGAVHAFALGFRDPIALAITPDGVFYVLDGGPRGRLFRVAPDGRKTRLALIPPR